MTQEIHHPYIKTLEASLSKHYNLYERLLKRNQLIRENYSTKSEYEKNEVEITSIKTQTEIDSLKKVINAREEYFRKFIQQFAKDLEECEAEFENVLAEAKQKSAKNEGLKEMLDAVNWKAVELDTEVKVKLYQRMKQHLKK